MAGYEKFQQGLLGVMQDPMFQMGMGLLARPRQNFGRAFGGAARDMSLSQMALQQARDQALQTQQQNAQKQREQEWIQQNMPGMAGAPGWMQQAAGEAQFSQPKVNPKMVMGPGGKPIWANAPDAIGQQAYSKPLVHITNAPKPPAGFVFKNPESPMEGVVAIPGSEAEQKQLERSMDISEALQTAQSGVGLINEMLKHPGLEYAVGGSSVLPIVPGTPAADFDAKARQLEGKAFLQAFETLKGGGQITQIEGEKATAAIARLQRSQSEPEYKASLREIRNIYQRAVSRGRRKQTRGGPSQAGGWSVEVIE